VPKEVLATFTDSDCIPAPNWLEAGVRHLLSVPKCGLVGGKRSVFLITQTIPTAVEVYDSINYLNKRNMLKSINGSTANLFAFKREYF